MGILFTRMPRPRQFDYQPLYYDERKERLEKIKARADAELAAEKKGIHHTGLQKGFLAENREGSKFRYTDLKASSGRLLRYVIIVVVILGIFYFVAPDVFLAFWKFK